MHIIACGNPDRGDDGAGVAAGERLRALGIPVEIQTGEAFALVEAWRDSDDVLVIDTVVSGTPVGTLRVWEGNELPQFVGNQASSHGFGIAEAIRLSRILGCLPRRLRVIGIEGHNFAIGSEVSLQVAQAVDRAVNEALGLLAHEPELVK